MNVEKSLIYIHWKFSLLCLNFWPTNKPAQHRSVTDFDNSMSKLIPKAMEPKSLSILTYIRDMLRIWLIMHDRNHHHPSGFYEFFYVAYCLHISSSAGNCYTDFMLFSAIANTQYSVFVCCQELHHCIWRILHNLQ